MTEALDILWDDGSLCLGAPAEVRRRFAQNRTLLAFVEDQVISYLFNFSYMREYGMLPYGELSHGPHGLLEYYNDHLATGTAETLMLLSCLASSSAPRRKKCPCGTGKKLKDCHGPRLKELRSFGSRRSFRCELEKLIAVARRDGVRFSRRLVLPERSRRKRRRRDKSKRGR